MGSPPDVGSRVAAPLGVPVSALEAVRAMKTAITMALCFMPTTVGRAARAAPGQVHPGEKLPTLAGWYPPIMRAWIDGQS